MLKSTSRREEIVEAYTTSFEGFCWQMSSVCLSRSKFCPLHAALCIVRVSLGSSWAHPQEEFQEEKWGEEKGVEYESTGCFCTKPPQACSHRLNAIASVRTASYICCTSLVRITALSPYPSKIKGSYNVVTRLLPSGYFTLTCGYPLPHLHLCK